MLAFKQHIALVKKMGQCSLKSLRNGSSNSATCFDDEALHRLSQRHGISNASQDPYTDLIRQTGCEEGDDKCLAERSGSLHDPRISQYIKAPKPQGMSWIEFQKHHAFVTTEITRCLKQYSEYFAPKFSFIGTFPADFNKRDKNVCIGKSRDPRVDLCNFQVNNLLRSQCTSFALVLNTHPYHKRGEHWVAIFCELDKSSDNYGALYYDSNGIPSLDENWMSKHAIEFLVNVKNQIKDKSFKIRFNTKRHQYKDGQCGMFAISFVIAMVIGHNFDNYNNAKWVNDELMESLRRIFFS